ncbi:SERTA domain-containing protein 3 [Paramarasmius palmivorus]|uniref:SERTA domain-containing protein 3 n=1 Tax=Paramarasmius palmivorus TaxID=297713 RepID=A0AAW0AYU2_9AGAR
MPNPGVFHGAQLRLLEMRLPGYFAAAREGWGVDYISQVQRDFFKVFKPGTPDNFDPTNEEMLAAIEAEAEESDELLVEPVRERSPRARKTFSQMDRWFPYRFRKSQEANMKESDVYRRLLSKLTGMDVSAGRRRPPYVLWARENAGLVEELVRERMKLKHLKDEDALRRGVVDSAFTKLPAEEQIAWVKEAQKEFAKESQDGFLGAQRSPQMMWAVQNSPVVDQLVGAAVAEKQAVLKFEKKGEDAYVAIRQDVVRREYEKLADSVKQSWVKKAKEEQEERVKKIKKEKNAPFPTDPESRQKSIERISPFVTPILQGMAEATGWNFTLVAGGPEPADGGRLNMTAIHIGTTVGAVPLTFGAAFRPQIKQLFNPLFAKFLNQSFSVAECQRRALKSRSMPCLSDLLDDSSDVVIHERVDDREGNNVPQASTSKVSVATTSSKSAAETTDSSTLSTPASPPPRPPHARMRPPCGPPRLVSTLLAGSNAVPTLNGRRPAGIGNVEVPNARSDHRAQPSRLQVSSQRLIDRTLATLSPTSSTHSSPVLAPQYAFHTPPSPSSAASSPPPASSQHSSPPPASPASSAPPASPPPASSPPPELGPASAPSPRTYKTKKRTAASTPSSSTTAKRAGVASSKRQVLVGVVLPVKRTATTTDSRERKRAKQDKGTDEQVVEVFEAEASTSTGERHSGTSKKAGKRAAEASIDAERASTSASKRRKTDNTSADPVPEHVPHMVSTPANAPKYVQHTLSICHEVQMDRGLRDVVQLWLQLDVKAGFVGSRLCSTNRPRVVHDWIARARAPGFKPKVDNLDKYAEDFEAWYKVCCPWRKDCGQGIRLTRENGQDWSDLAVYGPNGIVSFVVALAWWKKAVQRLPFGTPRQRQEKEAKNGLYRAALARLSILFVV